jgi:hypothetical protein
VVSRDVLGAGWGAPWHCTVIGAAHQRKGVVCQDFSLVRQLRAPAGQTLQLLAVADGHGGERYRYSDRGSRLACEQAAKAVQAALGTTPIDNHHAWQRQLSHHLPAVIQDRWLRAVQRDWQQKPDAAGQPFCPSLYGSTLGLVLLAPTWWGCTGLGDWDLVRVGSDGTELLSEENEQPGGGEATASLCQTEAAARWAVRAQWQPIEARVAPDPFSLLISTDGVRKSCATDQDFLELCSQIIPIGHGPELAEGLAKISAGGSGDDLSIAVGCWGSSSKGAGAGASSKARPSASLLLPLVLAMGAVAWWAWTQRGSWIQTEQPPAGAPAPINPLPWIQQAATQLCRNPELIGPTLTQRQGQFSQLLSGGLSRQHLLGAAQQDPLAALIAWSQPSIPEPRAAGPAASPPPPLPLPLPGSCPALELALASQWRSLGRPGIGPATPAPTP